MQSLSLPPTMVKASSVRCVRGGWRLRYSSMSRRISSTTSSISFATCWPECVFGADQRANPLTSQKSEELPSAEAGVAVRTAGFRTLSRDGRWIEVKADLPRPRLPVPKDFLTHDFEERILRRGRWRTARSDRCNPIFRETARLPGSALGAARLDRASLGGAGPELTTRARRSPK